MKKKICCLLLAILLLSSTSTLIVSSGNEKTSIQRISAEVSIEDMIEQVDQQLVYYYHDNLMSYGVRYTGTVNATMASNYIYEEFEQMGLDVTFHDWTFAGYECRNVVATHPGTDPHSTAIYILCAHYDTVPGSIGANDDGSGVAGVLAAAKILSQYSFNHTLCFIAFSGEEVGTYGSFSYARDAYRKGDNIIAVFNADMIGYASTPKGGEIIRFFQPDRSSWMADYASSIAEKYTELINLTVEKLPNYIGADHQAFIDYGYDGSWIAHYDGYPYGHSPEDTPDKINWTYQIKATRLLLAIMAEIGQKPIPVQLRLTSPLHGYGYLFNTPLIPLDLGHLWYKQLRGITIVLGRATATAEVYSNEEIDYVVFCINNHFMYFDYEPPYEWKIQGKHFPPFGRIKLQVYAYTTSGNIAFDEMDLIIFTLSSQHGYW